jgi:hypothetical protein
MDGLRMTSLLSSHLMTLALDVDFAGMLKIGETPQGRRRIAPVTGGSFTGERINGEVLGGADWVINRPDGAMAIDVRLTLKTSDGALVYLAYQGVFKGTPDVMARFNRGERISDEEFTLRIVARFECGDARYAWLNDLLCVGVAQRLPGGGPQYTIYEIH